MKLLITIAKMLCEERMDTKKLAETVGITEEEVKDCIKVLKKRNMIRKRRLEIKPYGREKAYRYGLTDKGILTTLMSEGGFDL